jgi:hypothetical protein
VFRTNWYDQTEVILDGQVDVGYLTRTVRIALPGIAHQFAAGHRIEPMLAGGDVNHRGG